MSNWQAFERDPRDSSYATLRASDADRTVVQQILTDGFADGRLDRVEYDERLDAVLQAKTLGDLPVLIDDLVIDPAGFEMSRGLAVPNASPELRQQATIAYERRRRNAFFEFLTPNLICWAIYLMTGTAFPWPIFVTIGTGVHLARILTSREEMIDEEVKKLQKAQRKRAITQPEKPTELD